MRWAVAILCLAAGRMAFAQEAAPPEEKPAVQEEQDPDELSIEDLMKLEVTSVSKKEQKLIESPSAVTVIRGEDLRRTGVTSIPDALRMVPGVQVARIDSSKWAISARGFSDRFSNKLLVLIDGRSVYTPLFSGVYWDVQDLVLEDVERIEVIRGPGASVWGSNAVNGVINIITKRTAETQGGMARGGAGTEEKGFGELRYGGVSGDTVHYRAWARGFGRDGSRLASHEEGEDDWALGQAGFRVDWRPELEDLFTFEGRFVGGRLGGETTIPILTAPFSSTFDDDTRVAGGHVQARWERLMGEGRSLTAHLILDRTDRRGDLLEEVRDTADVEIRYRFPFWEAHDAIVGVGYRVTADELDGSQTLSFDDSSRVRHLVNAFIHDEIRVSESLRLSVGSKFEYNSYTQVEVQPSARVLWAPDERHAAWVSVSRAVRTPSRAENDVRLDQTVMPGAPPTLIRFLGNDELEAEDLLALEFGYRTQPAAGLSIDTAFFFNWYRDVRGIEPAGAPFLELVPAPMHVVVPFSPDNSLTARSYGAELSVRWQAVERVRFDANYSWLKLNADEEDGSQDTVTEDELERGLPRHQLWLRGSFDVVESVEFDLMARYVAGLPGPDVESYAELDARLAWRPQPNLELAIVGQNLLHRSHLEFQQGVVKTLTSEVERGGYFSITWRF